ncbi:hypothetical protein EG68_06691 [Paragonimus skrjabini miyazakii]|uniref:Homeobox domain-containing protein n=1 Tax=Paragonimus skrjabini miyazakii TaxID=59628 RepID=A0A8S9YMU3_9TREM|nr:hypothetical protein EG68_06691 [Paragonimus skrjabini miyazakii]
MNCTQCIQAQNLFSIDAILAPDRKNQSTVQVNFSNASSVMRKMFQTPQMNRTGLFTPPCKSCVIWPDGRQKGSGLNSEVKTDGGTVSHACVRPDCQTIMVDQQLTIPGMERWMETKFAKSRNPRIPFSRTQVKIWFQNRRARERRDAQVGIIPTPNITLPQAHNQTDVSLPSAIPFEESTPKLPSRQPSRCNAGQTMRPHIRTSHVNDLFIKPEVITPIQRVTEVMQLLKYTEQHNVPHSSSLPTDLVHYPWIKGSPNYYRPFENVFSNYSFPLTSAAFCLTASIPEYCSYLDSLSRALL